MLNFPAKNIAHRLLTGIGFLFLSGGISVYSAPDSLPSTFKGVFDVGAQFYDFQNYQNVPYFHGGLDLCTPAGTTIYTPVGGMVAINDYKITAANEPHMFSYARRPFKRGESSQTRYLEVAVTTSAGQIWMFRHVDPSSIPAEVFDCVESGRKLPAGSPVGRVATWLQSVLPEKRLYDHLHLEILDADGSYLNPADLVKTGKDYYPPVIHGVYAARHGSADAKMLNEASVTEVSGNLDLIVAVTDRMNRAGYLHSVQSAAWSLEELGKDGSTRPLEQHEVFRFDKLPFKGERVQLSKVFYRSHLNTPSGKITANGSTGPRFFLVNLTCGSKTGGYSAENCLQTSQYSSGQYRLNITVSDRAGNSRQQSFSIRIKN